MVKREAYPWWKHGFFWSMWLLLLAPGYCAAFGFWLIGSLLPGYHEVVDITLAIIMLVTLLAIMAVAAYTCWHFVKSTRSYLHLVASLLVGLLGIPLVSSLGAIFSYVQLA